MDEPHVLGLPGPISEADPAPVRRTRGSQVALAGRDSWRIPSRRGRRPAVWRGRARPVCGAFPGRSLVVVGPRCRVAQGGERGEGEGPFELLVSASGWLLAADRAAGTAGRGASPAQAARPAVGKGCCHRHRTLAPSVRQVLISSRNLFPKEGGPALRCDGAGGSSAPRRLLAGHVAPVREGVGAAAARCSAHPITQRAATPTADETARGQGLRLRPSVPMAPLSWSAPSHRPQGRRVPASVVHLAGRCENLLPPPGEEFLPRGKYL